MDLLYTIGITALALGLLISFHEWGHFWVARRCGVKVLRFSIGFGKPLLGWRDRQGTEFTLAAIPLGGYVKMLDERVEDVPQEQLAQAFNRQSVAKRMAIVAAGPIANFLLAVALYYLLFIGGVSAYRAQIDNVLPESIAAEAGLQPGAEIVNFNGESVNSRQGLSRALLDYYGQEDIDVALGLRAAPDAQLLEYTLNFSWPEEYNGSPLKLLGIELFQPPVTTELSRVLRNSAAHQAGLQAGDTLQRLDGRPLDDWAAWSAAIRSSAGRVMTIDVLRDGQRVSVQVKPDVVERDGQSEGQLGVVPTLEPWPDELIKQTHYSFISAWSPALAETWDKTKLTGLMLKKMLTGDVSVKQIGGPISIAQQASLSSKLGWRSFVGLLALLSISLGVLNLLPIPVLDGGQLCFLSMKPFAASRSRSVIKC